MKLIEFNKHFLKTKFNFSLVVNKKPNTLLKRYILRTRLKNYVCLNYFLFFSVIQQMIFFMQYSISNKTPFIFFIEDTYLHTIYKELLTACNEFLCYAPYIYANIQSWNPTILSNETLYGFPRITTSSIMVSTAGDDYSFFTDMLLKGWPCIILTTITLQKRTLKRSLNIEGSSYIIPGNCSAAITELYFNIAFLTKIIQTEKRRRLFV